MSDTSQLHVKQILKVISGIPKGSVLAYGEVARRAGLPGRARWVARILKSNECEDLPWHRVVRADGKIAFTQGTLEYEQQCQRLVEEGVQLSNGKILQALVTPSLDELLWKLD